jgi:hypothetical protein
MAQISWKHKGSGNWTNASYWSSGTVPGASDDAFIGINGVTVTSNHNTTVDSIGTNTYSTLSITGKSWFTATNGTGSSVSLGTIKINGDSTMQIGAGTFYNGGTILLGSSGGYNTFLVDKVVQLEGGGTIEMAAHTTNIGGNWIQGQVSTSSQLMQLDNVDNVIAGTGTITGMYFDNQANGIVETNSNLGAGVLTLLENGIAGQGIANEGHIFADDGGTLRLVGDPGTPGFFNAGTIYMESTGDMTTLEIGGDVILKGGGHLTMSSFPDNYIVSNGQAATFENVDNVITGSGNIYDQNLTFVNDAQGQLILNVANGDFQIYTGNNTVANAGLIEAGASNALIDIFSPINNSGTIAANNGGVLSATADVSGSGKAEIFSGSQMWLMGTSNQVAATFENNAGDNGLLELAHSLAAGGSRAFSGTIAGLAFDGTHSDTLDLQDINFAGGVNWSFQESTNGNRGTLTVSDSMGDTAKLTLLGQYLAAGASANSGNSNLFGLAADHTSGTLVTTTYHG